MSKFSKLSAALFMGIIIALSASVPGFSQDGNVKDKMMKKGMEMTGMAPNSDTSACAVRKTLNLLLAEHVFLGAMATNAALNGNQQEFEAAAAALDVNSQAIAAANGSVYGQAAADAFLPLWRKHIGYLVDYTQAVSAGDAEKQEQAKQNLMQYAKDFGAFIHSASPSLPAEAVAALVEEHGKLFLVVIDEQAAGNDKAAYTAVMKAAEQVQSIADAHAQAVVQQYPEKFQN